MLTDGSYTLIVVRQVLDVRHRSSEAAPVTQPTDMRAFLDRSALFCLVAATILGCAGETTELPAAPTAATLEVSVTTTGTDIDPDGFLLSVDGAAGQALPANGTVSWTGVGGSHTLAISGLAFNCDLTTAPTAATLALGQTTHVDVSVNCPPFLSNAIVYVSDAFGFGEVMVSRTDGSRQTRLTTDQAVYAVPAISPDGKSIAVASHLGGAWNAIYVLDRFGSNRAKLVGRNSFDGSPAWSPDGTRLAFRSELAGPYGNYGRIFVVNTDGTGLHQLTPETPDYTYDDSPSWSPDGSRLLYSHSGALYVINVDGTSPTSLGVGGSDASWSPDGSRIAYAAYTGNVEHLYVVDANGTNNQQLTTPTYADQYPRWSPDGKLITFQRVESQTPAIFHVYKIAPDGTGLTRLDTATASEYEATWSPMSR